MHKGICVFASSSQAVDYVYFEAAEHIGRLIGHNGDTLIFGAGKTGLMGATAKGAKQENGKIIGVIPEALNIKGVVHETCDELYVTTGMRERKGAMDKEADAFIAIPGGYGTLEEILEIITLKQLRYHNRPIVILNTNGFYDGLLKQFEKTIQQNFAKPQCKELYYVAKQPQEAINYIYAYEPLEFEHKWMTELGEEIEV
jgi:uncharacterized protein (TIGR00730 family)